jgi:two-component system cell cycle sensor histidine kinase/response regulator CckA
MVAERKGRILVMDDEGMVRRSIARLLECLGYDVGLAGDGVEAIALYREARRQGRPFDLVIMDLVVPKGMGGQETMDRLRQDDPGVRAIIASGHTNDPVMVNFRAHGFRAVIRKPFDIDELDRVVRQGLEAEP